MSGMMLHGLGDCTPERNCGCMVKAATPPPASTTTTRTEYISAYKRADGTWVIGQPVKQRKTAERYVATALRMLWTKPTDTAILTRQVTVTETPWERIEDDE